MPNSPNLEVTSVLKYMEAFSWWSVVSLHYLLSVVPFCFFFFFYQCVDKTPSTLPHDFPAILFDRLQKHPFTMLLDNTVPLGAVDLNPVWKAVLQWAVLQSLFFIFWALLRMVWWNVNSLFIMNDRTMCVSGFKEERPNCRKFHPLASNSRLSGFFSGHATRATKNPQDSFALTLT